jgi:hypothetical protein
MAPEDEHGGDTWHLRHRFNYITSKHTRAFVRLVIEFFISNYYMLLYFV